MKIKKIFLRNIVVQVEMTGALGEAKKYMLISTTSGLNDSASA